MPSYRQSTLAKKSLRGSGQGNKQLLLVMLIAATIIIFVGVVGILAAVLITATSMPPSGPPQPLATTPGANGGLFVKMTDADSPLALNASEVWITVSGIEVHSAGDNWTTIVQGPKTFELISLINKTADAGFGELAPGHYTQIRFNIASANFTAGNSTYPLTVPSDRIMAVQPFDIVAGKNSTLVLDINAKKSLFEAGGTYKLKPILKTRVE